MNAVPIIAAMAGLISCAWERTHQETHLLCLVFCDFAQVEGTSKTTEKVDPRTGIAVFEKDAGGTEPPPAPAQTAPDR